ncbi:7,8-dihydropterin-6-yl-methyl-4-(beta-D-ribofuranosyl)aminobenzene 5'-phosphate synthase [Desulfofundulus luciae]|uniref:7, 8-dihydropterin-6-yl-methyl-4-(Beta-D-ribofuranosyl)aminobenzene 5'-phosphate synthase n=2 Tax=Desulfofundulus luciae TaxID=74702 RepID=A0ABU0B3U4_9FIRM|nr:7,8-dihydropterin-6-yl-methyl-4-(beta-D-ribofuranosyl)aminobenzene 5'-phosphate synthase [Desulfofundulus luciae]
MMVKITVLSENTVGLPLGLSGEWGLALLVETAGTKVLFDTGERGNILANAAALGINLQEVDALVMSHGHYDHSGGMRDFLRLRGRLPVYVHPDFFALHYVSQPREQYIGVPFRQEELESLGADFIFEQEPQQIAPGLWVSGEVPRKTTFEKGDSRLFSLENDNKVADPFRDDMSLYCVTDEGVVIILGCAHAGVVNIVEHARQVTGIDRIYGIIGGTHLGPASKEQQEATIAYLKNLDLKFLAANHCTGLPVAARLAAIFGPTFHFAPAGASFTLPLKEGGRS